MPTCVLKLSTGIGIGSSTEDVIAVYKNAINTKLTTDKRIVLGDESYYAICFIFYDSYVQSIYISTSSFDFGSYYLPEN